MLPNNSLGFVLVSRFLTREKDFYSALMRGKNRVLKLDAFEYGDKNPLTKETSPGGQIDAFVVVLYATAMFLGGFGRFSAMFHEC